LKNYDTMVDAVNTYFDEAFYQLADGFRVENHEFDLERGERGVYRRGAGRNE
jgi:hypothetical protein